MRHAALHAPPAGRGGGGSEDLQWALLAALLVGALAAVLFGVVLVGRSIFRSDRPEPFLQQRQPPAYVPSVMTSDQYEQLRTQQAEQQQPQHLHQPHHPR